MFLKAGYKTALQSTFLSLYFIYKDILNIIIIISCVDMLTS